MNIRNIRLNLYSDIKDYNFATVEAEITLNSITKEVNIPYELIIKFLKKTDPNLKLFLSKRDLQGEEEIMTEIIDLGIDIENIIIKYIQKYYNEKNFSKIPVFDY